MEFAVAGLNYKSASLEVREQMALSAEETAAALRRLVNPETGYAREGVILSTCNRTEVYAVLDKPPLHGRDLIDFLTWGHGLPREDFEPYVYSYQGREAVRHLFRVVAGLDSMILGEVQIVGQVRRALESSRANNSLGSVLGRVFSRALETAKTVRAETRIGQGAASVSSAAAELACRFLGTLEGKRLLLIGAGKVGELSAGVLSKKGANNITVASRTSKRARELAKTIGGEVVDLDGLEDVLSEYDIVVSATNAPHYVLGFDQVASATVRRTTPVLLIDLGVPRDIDPRVAQIDGVRLYNIDDLGLAVEATLERRERERERAERIVDDALNGFARWWASLEAIPTVRALRQRAEAIRQAELSRALRSLPHLSAQEQQTMEALTNAIVNKLLHSPTIRLKDGDGSHPASWYQEAAATLFHLNGAVTHQYCDLGSKKP